MEPTEFEKMQAEFAKLSPEEQQRQKSEHKSEVDVTVKAGKVLVGNDGEQQAAFSNTQTTEQIKANQRVADQVTQRQAEVGAVNRPHRGLKSFINDEDRGPAGV